MHQHHCSVGLGTALLPQLQRLDAWLRAAGRGCRVRIATVVRKPVAHLESSIYYNNVKRKDVSDFVKQHSNSQAKYLLYGDDWRQYMESIGAPEASPPGLEENATSALNGVEILGTTEELPAFTARLAKLLEVPVPTLEHVRCAHVAGGVERRLAGGPCVGSQHGPLLVCAAQVHSNTNHSFELTDADRSLMYQHSEVDRLLYRRFSADAKAHAADSVRSDRHQLEMRPPSGEQAKRDPLLKSPWPFS